MKNLNKTNNSVRLGYSIERRERVMRDQYPILKALECRAWESTLFSSGQEGAGKMLKRSERL